MSTANWEEIKRLAADFQRAQLSISTQKLFPYFMLNTLNMVII